MNLWKQLSQKKDNTADPFDLDTPLLAFSPQDTFTIRNACEGVHIWGAIGSGKTSGSGAAIAKAYLRAGFGGIFMTTKPEDTSLYCQYVRETGREKSLVIVSPEHSNCFNFFLYEQTRAGRGAAQVESLVNVVSEVVALTEGGHVETSSGDSFWPRAMREMLRNCISLLLLALDQVSIDHVCQFIADAPETPDQVSDEAWQQNSFCAQCIRLAEQKEKTAVEAHSFETASRYWLKSYAGMSSRMRSSITATFTSCADILQHGAAWQLLCTETNVSPELAYTDGAIILLDLPVQEFGETGRVIQQVWKYFFQRAILRRNSQDHPRPCFVFADEAQAVALSRFDFQYQAVARSARACTVYLSQNISNYYSVLGAQGREQANAFLGNLVTQIFHANSDHNTNHYATDLIAQHWAVKSGGGFSISNDNRPGESTSNSGSWNEVLTHKVQPAEFTTMRKGGPANNYEVDSVIFQGGRVFKSSGETYLKTVFKQQR